MSPWLVLVSTLAVAGVVCAKRASVHCTNHPASLSGTIVSVFGNKFVLRDGARETLVDTGPRWYRQHSFTMGERVIVIGRFAYDEFEAYRLTRDNGQTIEFRPAEGPPPWAGRRGH